VVVDIGCGNGAYLAELRRRGHIGVALGLDMSEGMARLSAEHAPTGLADAQSLPLRSASVDVALSLHMLYHVPDPARAVAEMRRVVAPTGRALVALNGTGHTYEPKAILAQAARRVTGIEVDVDWDTRFLNPDRTRTLLAAHFTDVECVDVGGAFAVPEPAIVSGYLASWSSDAFGIDDGPLWIQILAEADELIAAHFARQPTFTVTSRAVVLIGR
jgi:SAM-dependent methyltransferase